MQMYRAAFGKEVFVIGSISADTVFGLLIPFLGTAAGSACVFFMKRNLQQGVQRALTGFASGVNSGRRSPDRASR
jgi:hypothetical protein